MGNFTKVNPSIVDRDKVDYDKYIEEFIETGYEYAEFDYESTLGKASIYNFNFQTIVNGLRKACKSASHPIRVATRNYRIYFVKEG